MQPQTGIKIQSSEHSEYPVLICFAPWFVNVDFIYMLV